MDRSERFYKIHGLLQRRRLVRTHEFLEELEVSKRGLQRRMTQLGLG